MRKAWIPITVILAAAAFGQEPAVERSAIWSDTVKRGDLPIMLRGLGVLAADKTAEIKLPEDLIKQVQPGQKATVDTGQGVVNGKVARVRQADVVVKLEEPLPDSARPGRDVDGTIYIRTLKDVVYVGRPVVYALNGENTIFLMDADGQHASRVKVQYGAGSINRVEIRSGLQPGDRVILSDMSAYKDRQRVRVQ